MLTRNRVLPANDPGAPALEDFGDLKGHSFDWLVDLAAGTWQPDELSCIHNDIVSLQGTAVGLQIRDSTGLTGTSAPFTIEAGCECKCKVTGRNPDSLAATI